MRVWIDIENPPQVQYLAPFKGVFEALGHDVEVTARDNSITLDLLGERGVAPRVVGGNGSTGRARKIAGVLKRSAELSRAFRGQRPDILVATSRAAALSAWLQRIHSFTFCDYEHVDFRTVRLTRAYVFHPDVITQDAFTTKGLRARQLIPFHGLKETISFSGLDIDATAAYSLPTRRPSVPHVLFRPPGEETHYFVPESLTLALDLLGWLARRDDLVVVYSPRYPYQTRYLEDLSWANPPIVLREAVPFVPLLKSVDLVVSSGGTMLREAAYLGLPAYSIFRSALGEVDRYLASIGRLTILDSPGSFERIRIDHTSLDPLPGADDLPEQLARQMIDIAGSRSRFASSGAGRPYAAKR